MCIRDSSYLLVYVGWEGVGLASYLLIGFWNWNPPYASAANKAFVANRVGDVGMGLAIMAMFWQFGAVDFQTVNGAVAEANEGALTVIGPVSYTHLDVYKRQAWKSATTTSARSTGPRRSSACRLLPRRLTRPTLR